MSLAMRYLPLDETDRAAMLARIGVAGIDDLFADIPPAKRLGGLLDMPGARSEMEVERLLSSLAARNVAAGSAPFFVGAGAYRHHVPASVDHLIQRSEFLTAYTPYQPEIAQGTLQVLFEFQTQVAALTGMEVANASMYDGSTACGEAILMAHRLTRRAKAVLSGGLHPQYADVAATLAGMAGDRIVRLSPDVMASEDIAAAIDDETSCVVVQTPDFFGNLRDLAPIKAAAQAKGALLVAVFTEAVSLGLLRAPGEMGADIVVGEGQSIGNALNFGGPYVGLFATHFKHARQMPGRLAGETIDAGGTAQLRADAFDARAAYSPGEGDEQHLHQFRPLRAGVLDPYEPARPGRVAAARKAQSRQRRSAGRPALRREGRQGAQRMFLQRIHHPHAAPRRGADRGARRKGVIGGLPVSRLRRRPGLDDLIVVASTETNSDEDRAAYAAILAECL